MGLWAGLTRSRRWRGALLASGFSIGATVMSVGPSSPVAAQLTGLPPGFVDELVVGGLPFPTAVAFAPTGTTFVALKRGEVRVYEGATALGTFIDINARVHDNHDRGLLGLAVHPEFPEQPYVYLLYTHDDRPVGVAADLGSPVQGRTSQLLRVTADPNPSGAPPLHAGGCRKRGCAPRQEQRARQHRKPERRAQHVDGVLHEPEDHVRDTRRGLHPVRREFPHDRHGHVRARRIVARQQRRWLELQRRRSTGAARPTARQPGRQGSANRSDHRPRPAGQPVLRPGEPEPQPLQGLCLRAAQPVPDHGRSGIG